MYRHAASPLKSAAIGLGVFAAAISLGLASTRQQVRAEREHARFEALHELETSMGRASGAIADAYRALVDVAASARNSGSLTSALESLSVPFPVWLETGGRIEVVGGSQAHLAESLADARVRRTLAAVTGPIATADGREFVLIEHVASATAEPVGRVGLALVLGDLFVDYRNGEGAASQLDFALVDPAGQTLYRSSLFDLPDPVATTLRLPGVEWRVEAAPRAGWPSAADHFASIVIAGVLAAFFGLSAYRLSARPRELAADLGALAGRLDDKDRSIAGLLRERAELEARLVSSLTIDLPTGLRNASSFVERVQNRLAKLRLSPGGGVYVATVLLSRLEDLSVAMGSGAAENAVKQGADTLRDNVPCHDDIGRTGEKELSVLLDVADYARPQDAARFLLDCFERRVEDGPSSARLYPAIGVATTVDGYCHAQDLIAAARIGAATAAAEGRSWSEFRAAVKDEKASLLELETDLERAMVNGELRLHFQPIVELSGRRIAGVEALLRWHHPTRSWIEPERFMVLIEGIGQRRRMAEWVIRQTVAYGKQWLGRWDRGFFLTLNLTPRDLSTELIEFLFAALRDAGVPAKSLRVEIPESAVAQDVQLATRLIGDLSDRGIDVVLDDFGSGYSSLSYLRDLPFRAVKLDGSFARKLSTDARDFGLVRSIVSLAHYLGLECIAGGIETQDQLDLVEMTGCNHGQGAQLYRPMPPAEIESVLGGDKGGRALAADGR